jgi:hypothetical protein
MFLSPAAGHGPPLMMIEGGATAIAVALAFAWPRIGSRYFSRIERFFHQMARKKGLSVTIIGAATFLLRLAMLPLCPIPHPFIQDDFSFLLAADTFASGRLTNPTPAMWTHFETLLVSMKPTYQSVYFPAQGMLLAAGKLLTGYPWFGILVITALMAAALCWALQAWLPPDWALLGGALAVVRLALFSSWINTYSGAGSLTALAGALILGALPRFMKTMRLRDGLLMAVGVVLLGTSRPYEGALLCIPVAVALLHWAFFSNDRPRPSLLTRRAAIPLLVIIAGGAWMGYYNYRVHGNPLTPPYKLYNAEYGMPPYFIWQSMRPQPVYRHKLLREFYAHIETDAYKQVHNWRGYLPQTLLKAGRALLFYAGIVLLPPLVMLRRVFIDRRVRFLVLCVLVLITGIAVEVFFIPYYVALFTAAFYALGLQAMRHLRICKPGNQPVGKALVRLTVTLCFVLAGVRLSAAPMHIRLASFPGGEWAAEWYGPGPYGAARAGIEKQLEHRPGKQLAIVEYSQTHSPFDEWVYNSADIADSKVIWARDMGPAQNLQLIHYYKDRTAWLVQPDATPAAITPYPIPGNPSVPK